MNRRSLSLSLAAALVLSCGAAWCVDYLTEGVDSARTGWLRGEKVFNLQNVSGMKLLWKIKLNSQTREMHNLFPPLIAEDVKTANGSREVAVVAGISDDLWGLDAKTDEELWHTKYQSSYVPPPNARPAGTLCPGGQTAVPAMVKDAEGKYTVFAVGWDGRLRRINPADGKLYSEPENWLPPNAKPYALNIYNGAVYTSVSQGCGGVAFTFFSYDLATRKSSLFVPTGGGLWGRRGVSVSDQSVAYMGTGDGEYNPENGHFGNGLVGLKLSGEKELRLADYFAPPNADWLFKRDLDINVSPVAFDYKGKHLLIGTSKECRVWLLDRDELGGDDHRTALYNTPLICNTQANYAAEGVWGAMSAWKDAKGDQWVTVPFYGPVAKNFHAAVEHSRPEHGGIATFKVVEKAGKWSMIPMWLSEDMDNAEEAIIANGVMFAYASGEDARQAHIDTAWNEPPEPPPANLPTSLQSATRIPNGRRAVLYALDAATGKKLWSSGDQIAMWNHFTGISVANGRAYIPTFDGYVYCFGVAR